MNARIHIYRAEDQPGASAPGTGTTSDYDELLGGPGGTNNLSRYDMVILPCEGAEFDKNETQVDNLNAYANSGGRVFTTHYSYAWLYNTADNAGGYLGGEYNMPEVPTRSYAS